MDSSDTIAVDPRGHEFLAALAGAVHGQRVAYLATDLQNRRRWAQELGEHAARRLADLHDRIARSVMKKHLGRQVGPSGEYQMLFGCPDQALGFALAYYHALDKLSQGGAAEVVPGVGIHVGDDGARGREIAGKLAALAGDRRILLTRDAFDLTRPRLEASEWVRWQDLGTLAATGADQPLGVVEVRVRRPDADDSAA